MTTYVGNFIGDVAGDICNLVDKLAMKMFVGNYYTDRLADKHRSIIVFWHEYFINILVC
jgi:hypothetical protein